MFTNRSSTLRQSETPPCANTSDLRGRLSFSSARSPLLMTAKMSRVSSASPSPIANNRRLVNYHMSRQNPAVLDSMYLPSASLNHSYNTPSPQQLSNTSPVGSVPVVRSGKRHSVVMASLMKQSLNNNARHSLGLAGSSLVQLAAAKAGRVRNGYPSISPVIVKLSSRERNKGDSCKEVKSDDEDNLPKAAVDPCDKNVVVSALKLKSRKRWNSTFDDGGSALSCNNLPAAKRSKFVGAALVKQASPVVSSSPACLRPSPSSPPAHSGFVRPSAIPCGRKLIRERTVILPSTPDERGAKRSKLTQSGSRVFLPGMEDDHTEGVSVTNTSSSVTDGHKEHLHKKRGRERSSTPLVDVEESESDSVGKVENKKLKRESTVKLQASLSQVFPSRHTPGGSTRKKLPVLCATGTPPELPSDLSDKSLSVTGKELKRDRQALADRMKRYLAQDDDEGEKLGPKSLSMPAPPTTSSVTLSQKSLSAPVTGSISTALGGGAPQLGLGLTTSTAATSAPAVLGLLSTQPHPSLSMSSSSSSSTLPVLSSVALSSSRSQPTLSATAAPTVTSTCSSSGMISVGAGLQLGSVTSTQPSQSSSSQSSLPLPSFSFPLSKSASSELISLPGSLLTTGGTTSSSSDGISKSTLVPSSFSCAGSSSFGTGLALGVSSASTSLLKLSQSVTLQTTPSVTVSGSITTSSSIVPQPGLGLTMGSLSATSNSLSSSFQPQLASLSQTNAGTGPMALVSGIQTNSQQIGDSKPSLFSATTTSAASTLSSSLSNGGGNLSTGTLLQKGENQMQALPNKPAASSLNFFGGATQQNTAVSIPLGGGPSSLSSGQWPSSLSSSQSSFSFSVNTPSTLSSSTGNGASFGLLQQQPSVAQTSLFNTQPSQPGVAGTGNKLSQMNDVPSFKFTGSNTSNQSQSQPLVTSGALSVGLGGSSIFSQTSSSSLNLAAPGNSSNLFKFSAGGGQDAAQQQQNGGLLGPAAKLNFNISSNPNSSALPLLGSHAQQPVAGQTLSFFSGAGTAPSVSTSSSNNSVFGAGSSFNSAVTFSANSSQLMGVTPSGPFGNQVNAAHSQGGADGIFGNKSQPGASMPTFQFGNTGQSQQKQPLGTGLFQFSADSSQQAQNQASAAAPSLQLGPGTFNQQSTGFNQQSAGLMQTNNIFGSQSVPSTFNFSASGETANKSAVGGTKFNFMAGTAGVSGMVGGDQIQQQMPNTGMTAFNFSGVGGAQQQSNTSAFNFSAMGTPQQSPASSFNFSAAGAQQQSGSVGFSFSAGVPNSSLQQPTAMGGTGFTFTGNQQNSATGTINFSLGKSRSTSARPRGRRKK